MKTASPALTAHLVEQLTTLTVCIRITRTDDVIMAYTALDTPFTFEGHLHKIGYDPTAIVSTNQMSVDNLELLGAVDHEDITSADIRAGVYDGAFIEIYRVNYLNLSQGKIVLKSGWIGNVSHHYPGAFTAEARSLSQALQVKYGMLYTAHCKWDLGDHRCKFAFVGDVGGTPTDPPSTPTLAVWEPNHVYAVGDIVTPTTPNGLTYIVTQAGTSGAVEPDWDIEGDTEAGTFNFLTDSGLTDNKVYVITPAESGSYILQGPVGEMGTHARWAILQDGIGNTHRISTITDQLGTNNDGHWQTTNDIHSAVVEAVGSSYQLELTTFDNAFYACGEVDLFLCAVSPLPDVLINEPGIPAFAAQPFLSELDSLTMGWRQSIASASHGNRCGGGQDVAVMMASIYFKNTVNDQTLQYQIYTYDTRNFQPDGFWFNSAGPLFFGVADNISRYGGSYTFNVVTYSAEILDRVIALMAACPNGSFDDDPSHWKITLMTCGPFVNGAAAITATVAGLLLSGETATVPVVDIPDGTVLWQEGGIDPGAGEGEQPAPGASGTAPGSFLTPGVVATVIDDHFEFVVDPTGTEFTIDSPIPVPFWQSRHTYWPGDSVQPRVHNGLRAVVVSAIWEEKKKTQDTTSGVSGSSEPNWPSVEGERVNDNEVEWVMVLDRWYKDGVLKFTTGDNAGLAKQFEVLDYEVVSATELRFRLVLPTPYAIQVGDEFLVEAGCDKTHMTCIYKFDNILNFGGEPFVAGFNRPHDAPTDEEI